jgi:hypothetical protein
MGSSLSGASGVLPTSVYALASCAGTALLGSAEHYELLEQAASANASDDTPSSWVAGILGMTLAADEPCRAALAADQARGAAAIIPELDARHALQMLDARISVATDVLTPAQVEQARSLARDLGLAR